MKRYYGKKILLPICMFLIAGIDNNLIDTGATEAFDSA